VGAGRATRRAGGRCAGDGCAQDIAASGELEEHELVIGRSGIHEEPGPAALANREETIGVVRVRLVEFQRAATGWTAAFRAEVTLHDAELEIETRP
jgi:hypothetical protein